MIESPLLRIRQAGVRLLERETPVRGGHSRTCSDRGYRLGLGLLKVEQAEH
jgi:hypothetical protein